MIGALGHVAAGVLVPDQVELDAGLDQGVHDREHLAAGHAEGVAAAGIEEPAGEDLGGVRHGRSVDRKSVV